jgi:phenylalanine-4-hydroxylase
VRTVEKLPAYLRKYCAEQPADKYTSRDQAAWRYIMRQSRAYFKDHAVPIYLEGLKKTGITLGRIPLISEMDRSLGELGWGAVPVCGFIPPAAFLDFQARKILPIAYDMRSPDHIAYTPAPDIVHEAAGHAPIIADQRYSEYLQMYAGMAQKAIFSSEDLDIYEAIRTLSDVKENPDSSKDMIAAAEKALARANANVSFVSEAAQVARMNWWTVEYGLLGSLKDPKIYGAGLLSSVGESQNCLKDKVKKLRLTVDCIHTSYDITEPQPQLFVAEDIKHLCDVLQEMERTLSYHKGGLYGLEQALRSRTVTTTVLDSGIAVSGKLIAHEGLDFIKFEGPVQIAVGNHELPGQGTAQHPQGFSSPLGLPSDTDLGRRGLEKGQRGLLELANGFKVEGVLADVVRHEGKLVLLKWRDCTVTRGGQRYFEPAWGDFDMLVGRTVTSVYGGPAHRERYGTNDVGNATTTPGRTSPFTDAEKQIFKLYAEARAIRDGGDRKAAPAFAAKVQREAAGEWLLRLESIELLPPSAEREAAGAALAAEASNREPDIQWLIRQGLALAAVAD